MLNGRFMYGPLDVVTLTGEKVRPRAWPVTAHPPARAPLWLLRGLWPAGFSSLLSPPRRAVLGPCPLGGSAPDHVFSSQVDVYIMTQPLSGKWIHFGTEVTSSSGRLTFPVPPDRALGIGVYPVRMLVR